MTEKRKRLAMAEKKKRARNHREREVVCNNREGR